MPSRTRRLMLYVAALSGLAAGTAYAAQPSSTPSGAPGAAAIDPELPAGVVAASFGPRSTWKPEKAVFGTSSVDDIPVTMRDGTVLRVNVVYPTDPSTGRAAPGPFPVLLTQTPYGKGSGGTSRAGSAQQPAGGAATGGSDDYLAQRGYIEVIADVRGTGDSEGSWGLFDPVQTTDGIDLVKWAAHLPHSNGKVGTYGPSYLGINQLLLAGSIGRGSPLKAIFPMVAANDLYRDTSFMGGLVDAEFDEAYLGLTAAGNMANPPADSAQNPSATASEPAGLASVEAQHAAGLASYHAAFSAETLAGGPSAYEGRYWAARNPRNVLAGVVANGIPAYLVGGEFDIFQRGEPLNFAGLQNAWDHRPVGAPMLPGQPVTGRYQLIDGPWEHINGSSVDVDVLELAWFDQWLKGEETGIGSTSTPLHYYDIGTGGWEETTAYPFAGSTPQRLYLGNGTLRPSPPVGHDSGTSTLAWTGTGQACSRPVDQWAMGPLSISADAVGVAAPCAGNDAVVPTGPVTSMSFTSPPLDRPERLAGPMSATIYASANRPETEWVAEVEDVAPDGRATPLSEGALLGSLRALDGAASWRAGDGGYLLPYHPYTSASSQVVVPGATTRYDIEIFPTFATIAAGHRLRVTISTADAPHLSPTAPEAAALAGGVYTLEHTAAASSYLEVAVQPGA